MPALSTRRLLLVLAVLALAGPAAAQDPSGLLGKLAPRGAEPRGGVQVEGRLEPGPQGGAVLLTLRPHGDARLLGEPGILVTPLPSDGVAWTPAGPREILREGGGYFDAPPELRLPFLGRATGPLQARVEYAYCLIDWQCLFGEAVVAVEPPPA